jgi:hypothetical protein
LVEEARFWIEIKSGSLASVEKARQNRATAQQTSHPCIETGVGRSERRSNKLSGASIRLKQATEAIGRFDLSIHIRRSDHWHDQFVAQALMVSFCVIMNEETLNSSARRGLAKENQFIEALGFQSTEKSL